MDPITAIGLVSGILSFVSFSTKLVKGAIEIQEALDGTLDANRSRQGVTEEMRRLSACMLPPDDTKLSGDEKALCMLARECGSLSNQLIKLLEDIKPEDNASTRQSLWSSLKSRMKEKERLDLEQRLDYCQSQLGIPLHFVTIRQTDASLKAITELVKDNAGKFDSFRRSIQRLEHGISVDEFSTEAQEQIKNLLTLPDHVSKTISQQRILRALAFDEMRNRRDLVHNPHDETFKWFMYARKAVEEASKIQACERFTSWLESGHGVFHISGKLGSGKSTLMKFPGRHVESSGHLERWAGDRKLVFAQFFFWRPGTQLQKSLTGLYRTLLHDIFQSCPELIPSVMPSFWIQAESMAWRSNHEIEIDAAEIKAAFNRLVSKNIMDSYQDHCFCFFIDGIDEFEATFETDHTDLATLLEGWAEAGISSNNIKICVSSREHNSFMNTFSAERRLRLHELTHTDIIACVRDKLDRISASSGFDDLVHEIVGKGQGIFQWVAIVVNNIRSEIDNGITDAEEFRNLLKTLPSEINALYKHIFESLRNTTRAYRTLTMVSKATELNLARFSVEAYSFFHDYERDNRFILQESFQEAIVRPHGAGLSRSELGKTRLRGWCGGLLDTETVATDSFTLELVQLTHRSVSVFLKREDVKMSMVECLEGFDVLDAISQMLLADIRMFHEKCCAYDSMPRLFEERRDAGADSAPPFPFVEALDRVWVDKECLDRGQYRSLSLKGVGGIATCMQFDIEAPAVTKICSDEERRLDRPIYWTLLTGAYEYPLWKIQNDPSVTNNFTKTALLAHMVLDEWPGVERQENHQKFEVLNLFFDKGLLNKKTCLRPSYPVGSIELEMHDGNGSGVPIFYHFLKNEWMIRMSLTTQKKPSLEQRYHSNSFARKLARFLQQRSNVGFCVKITELGESHLKKMPTNAKLKSDYILRYVIFHFQEKKDTGEVEETQSGDVIPFPNGTEDKVLRSLEYSSLRD